MKVFITGSKNSGISTLCWLMSQSFQNHAVETLVFGKCASTHLKNVFGLSEADAPALTNEAMPEGEINFDADSLSSSTLPLDSTARQRFLALADDVDLNTFAKNFKTATNQFAIVPATDENCNGADVVVCVVEPTSESVSAYERIRKQATASSTPMLMVFNKYDANDPKPVFADAVASMDSDNAIAKHWWAGVTEKNRRQLTKLVNKVVEMQSANVA